MASALALMVVELAVLFLGGGFLLLAAVLIHEAGHAAAGFLVGFRIMGVRVGAVQIWRSKGWTWIWQRGNLIGGLVSAQFRDIPGPRARWQCFAFLISGSLANFCVAILTLPCFLSQTALATSCQFLSLFSAVIGAVNLIPFRTKRGFSDGAKLYWLLFKKQKREDLIFLFSLTARAHKVKAFCGRKQFKEALSEVDGLIDRAKAIESLSGNTEWLLRLSKLRESLQKQVEGVAPSKHAAD